MMDIFQNKFRFRRCIFFIFLILFYTLTILIGYISISNMDKLPEEDIVSYSTIVCDGRYFFWVSVQNWPLLIGLLASE